MTAADVQAPEKAASQRPDRDVDRRRELAEFLRSRRDRLTPDDVGIPSYGRRRTPGLRREEVATLAGVGITWYTWLEQGRDIAPSRSVLNALARTLMLDSHERRHLFALAGVQADDGGACHAVSETTLALLTHLEPLPALVQNSRSDILAFNRGFAWLLPEVAAEPEETRNFCRLAFTNASMRARMTNEAVTRLVATFRGLLAENMSRPAFKELLAELLATSTEFKSLWERHDVRMPENMHKEFRHELGVLRFAHTYLWTEQRGGTRIIALLPLDTFTRDALDAHVGRHPGTPLSSEGTAGALLPH